MPPLNQISKEEIENVNIKFTSWNSQQDREKAELLTMMWQPVNEKFKEYMRDSHLRLIDGIIAWAEKQESLTTEEYKQKYNTDNTPVLEAIGYNVCAIDLIAFLQSEKENIKKIN